MSPPEHDESVDHACASEHTRWRATAPGRYMLAWERERLDAAVADVFGFHALQLGVPELDALSANRMPHRWLAVDRAVSLDVMAPDALQARASTRNAGDLEAQDAADVEPQTRRPRAIALECCFDALPFPDQSIDLVVLPHTLELSNDAHETLREVERVLMPEGRLVILGFNPTSLWGLRQRWGRARRALGGGAPMFLPQTGDFIGYRRVRDWLRLLSFEVESGRFGCYRPPLKSARWLSRFAWMDRLGDRWWPVFGGVYFLLAVKRVRGMRLVGLVRQQRVAPKAASAVTAQRHQRVRDDLQPSTLAGMLGGTSGHKAATHPDDHDR